MLDCRSEAQQLQTIIGRSRNNGERHTRVRKAFFIAEMSTKAMNRKLRSRSDRWKENWRSCQSRVSNKPAITFGSRSCQFPILHTNSTPLMSANSPCIVSCFLLRFRYGFKSTIIMILRTCTLKNSICRRARGRS